MGATRFNGVVGSQPARQSGSTDLRPPQAFSMFPGEGYHLRVAGVDFGTTSVMSVSVEHGFLPGRPLQQHRSGLVCTFMLEGEVIFDDGANNPVTVTPGSCWTYGGSSDVKVTWGSSGRAVVAVVPHQVVRDFGLVPPGGFTLFPAGSTLLEPTRNFISAVAASTEKISSVAAYFMEKLVHEMIGGLFLEDSTVVAGGSNRPTLYHQAMALITASAGDRALTPESLARDLNVSLRHLQRDFQKRNDSVAERIRQTRVDLAVRLLTDPAMAVLTLDQIADHSGFASLGHLRRTLHSLGAGTPRDIRAFGLQQPAEPVAEQPGRQ
ncbi:helix-turn-helix domain-containing protein [Pseudarthrobacter sp. J75]|uniref:helix-turn-helix domain-containing protein n=1 Tax=unclassified Pseudarthrobacter TaxID=2647000 RepID=UPI002E816F4F|nr:MULTISPECIES: helix-turn-helix domain-containing protein [unclassified Pseudarthrobacter]MEE2523990.1 helix-turn-helix domain-containing protein [Pseudarthrobacter sp. J47]MEE2528242.1 helix-turn-helix domain-containing protein [Pseudarthrobacter sp. J75]MEE2567944.1 helix-turn-helix domain-containing protein [Pseudarthrobacter sp. J64]